MPKGDSSYNNDADSSESIESEDDENKKRSFKEMIMRFFRMFK